MEYRSDHRVSGVVSAIQIALMALVIAFAFATPFIPTARAATTVDVSIVNFAFQPDTITIQPGDTVRWTNNAVSTAHTVTSDSGSSETFDSGTLNQNDVFTHTFNSVGDFGYHCSIHPVMTGTIHVSLAIPEFSSLPIVMLGLLVVVLALTTLARRT